MMNDIVLELLKKIQNDFKSGLDKSSLISRLYAKVRDGTATYAEANDFAIEVGDILTNAYKDNLSSDILPDGKMYYNIAERILNQTMTNNYDLITDVTDKIQQALNEKAGIGIKPITPELNQDRIDGMVNKVSSAENFNDVAWVLDEPVINFMQSVVDDAVKANADFQYRSGLRPKIIRLATKGCCEWCANLAGEYDYEKVSDTGNNVFRRHRKCRCIVKYDPGDGRKYQDVHTKKWRTADERAKIETRKMVGLKSLPASLADHPKRLASYTPESLKRALEKEGYEIKTLKQGSLKNIAFEDGGGFKVNFEDGGILQYHPETKSHHDGAYYKISTGKGGRHRYDTEGNEKLD